MKEKEKLVYEPPKLEIIEFQLQDAIAASSDFGSDLVCNEGMFN